MVDVVSRLRAAPGLIMAFEFQTFADGKRRDAHAREAEMIGAVVMSRFGLGVGANGQTEFFSGLLYRGVERGALRAGDFYFLGIANGGDRVVVQIESDFCRGEGQMLAEIFGTEQALFFGGYGCE